MCDHGYFYYKGLDEQTLKILDKELPNRFKKGNKLICDSDIFDFVNDSGIGVQLKSGETIWTKPHFMDILDRRKGCITFFDYCPFCGQKNNFNKVKKMCTDNCIN